MNPNQDRAVQAAFDGYVPAAALSAANAEVERISAAWAAAMHESGRLRAAATNLMAAIDNMHERGETFTARVSIAASDMRRALEQRGRP